MFLDIENANERNFERPDLHKWVKDNRSKILSALYSLVDNWVELGMPKHKTPFASFPEWADKCGAIMVSAGYDDPCKEDVGLIGDVGDKETRDMKMLFELCYEKTKDYGEKDRWISKKKVKDILNDSEEGIFGYFDFDKKPDQVKFGSLFEKYVGRILSDIKLRILSADIRPSRQKYLFEKLESGNLGNLGNLLNPENTFNNGLYKGVGNTLPRLPRLPKEEEIVEDLPYKPGKHTKLIQRVLDYLEEHPKSSFKDILKADKRIGELDLNIMLPNLKKSGEIIETKGEKYSILE